MHGNRHQSLSVLSQSFGPALCTRLCVAVGRRYAASWSGHRGRYAAWSNHRGRYAACASVQGPLRGIRWAIPPERGRFSRVGGLVWGLVCRHSWSDDRPRRTGSSV